VVQDGKFRFINSNAASYAGYTREELLDQEAGLIVNLEDREKARQNARALLRGEESSPYEFRIITKQGETRWIMETVTSILHEGRPAILGNSMDVTERKRAEEALKEGERRLHSIIDGSPIPAFVIGKNHHVIHWNKALEEMSGIKSEEVVGTYEHWRAFYSEERPCIADLLLDDAVESIPQWYSGKYIKSSLIKGAYEVTDFFPTLGEDGKWLRFTASAVLDSKGMIVAAIETLEDITDRKRAEEALRENEERYRAFFETSRDCVFISSAEGRWIDLNDAAVELFGYSSRKELKEVQIRDLYADPKGRDRFIAQMHEKGYVKECPFDMRRKDGSIIHVLLTSVVWKDADGNVLGYRGTIRDVTEKRRVARELKAKHEELSAAYGQLAAYGEELRQQYNELLESQQALRASEERYRNIFENAIEGIYQSTPGGVFINVNPAMAKMCGYESPAEMVASITDMSTQYYVDYKDREGFKRLLDEHGRIDNIEYRIWRKDGSIIWVSVSARVVSNNHDDIFYYEGAVEDITERKRTEEARQRLEERLRRAEKMEALGTMAGGVAHDLNNVLGVLMGYSDFFC